MALVEVSEKKEKLLIEEKLIKRRIMMIFESEENMKYFDLLQKKQQKSIGKKILYELLVLKNQQINEGLFHNLMNLFGNIGTGAIQAIAEPFINSLLSKIGFPNGFVKNFVISALTKNWSRLGKAIKGDCREVSEILAESIIEALVMNLQQSKGYTGIGAVLLRDTLEDAIRSMVKPLEDKLMSHVCDFVKDISSKAMSLVKDQGLENQGDGSLVTI
jgi:hypothetical protein